MERNIETSECLYSVRVLDLGPVLSHGLIRVNQITLPVLIDLGLWVTVWVIESLIFQYSFDCGPNQTQKRNEAHSHATIDLFKITVQKHFFIWQFWHLSFVIQNLILDVCSSPVYIMMLTNLYTSRPVKIIVQVIGFCRRHFEFVPIVSSKMSSATYTSVSCQVSYLYRHRMSPVLPRYRISTWRWHAALCPSFEQLAIEFNDSNMHCVEDQSIKRTKPWRVLCCY